MELSLFLLFFILSNPASGTPLKNRNHPEYQLVDIALLAPSIRQDVRYSTSRNFLGKPIYSKAKIFLLEPAAKALVRVQNSLLKQGLSLLIFDGYRPYEVSKLFWKNATPKQRMFLAPPSAGSSHNRGMAVDVTLFDLKTGREVKMPSAYDEMSEKGSIYYYGGTPEERKLRNLLISEMEAEGFRVYVREWWHFDFKGWENYPLLNVLF